MSFQNSTASSTTWRTLWSVIGLLGITLLLTACSFGARVQFVTDRGYIQLKKGQTFTASRDMTLATEPVIQEKDQLIIDLLRANERLAARHTLE